MTEKKKRYHITDEPDGFRIEGEDRVPVRITRKDTHFEVRILRQLEHYESIEEWKDLPPGDWTDREHPSGFQNNDALRVGFFEYRSLVTVVAKAVMMEWTPHYGCEDFDRVMRHWRWIFPRTKKAINRRIYGRWQELLKGADPKVLAVQRKIFSVAMRAPQIVFSPELYKRECLVEDIINHRAAAIATANVRRLLGIPWQENAPAEQVRCWISRLGNWQGLFSPTGKSYPSLSTTLMNLPGGVPPHLVCELAEMKLCRPILDRVELIVVAVAGSSGARKNFHVFQKARRSEILCAMERVATATGNRLGLKTKDIRFLTYYLLRFPESHTGTLVGLADKAIRCDRELYQENRFPEAVESTGEIRDDIRQLTGDLPSAA